MAGLVATLPLSTLHSQQSAAFPTLPGLRGPLRVEIGTGYDFFSHSYTVLSADTATTTTDGNLRLNIHYTPLSGENHTLEIGDRFFLGRQYTWNSFNAVWRTGGWYGLSTSAETRLETKRFNEDGLAFSNDHDALLATLRGAWRWSWQWGISGRIRMERFDYSYHNSFFYDTRTASGTLALRGGGWSGPWFEVETGFRNRSAPDTTALDHGDLDVRLVLGWILPGGGELQATFYRNDRDYLSATVRPDRIILGLRLDGRFAPLSRWGLWYEAGIEGRSYSEQTIIYTDGSELRLAAGPSWHPGEAWEVRFGAGWQQHLTDSFADTTWTDLFGVTQITDSWSQPFLFTEASVISAGGFWAFLNFESGWRAFASDTEWDSDFLYLDVSATAEIPIWRGLALQALINLTPERHREPEDNSVTNYTSVDLLYRF